MPGKAIELDHDLRFELDLADRWHMPVRELRERLTSAEYVLWRVYFAKLAQDAEVNPDAR